jgi:hypothetical protein
MAKPVPVPDDTSAFYWQAAQDGRLVIQRCDSCRSWYYPPTIGCPGCRSEALVPTDVSGRGTVYTFTIVRQAFDPAFADDVPYVVALVELEEAPGLRMLTTITGVEPQEVRVGMQVAVAFEGRDGAVIPVFEPC